MGGRAGVGSDGLVVGPSSPPEGHGKPCVSSGYSPSCPVRAAGVLAPPLLYRMAQRGRTAAGQSGSSLWPNPDPLTYPVYLATLPACAPRSPAQTLQQLIIMQVFLPSRSFKETASILDNKRLNKQIVECKQIYASLTGLAEPYGKPVKPTNGWLKHPAVRMWKGCEHLLCIYAIYMRQEATRRNIADNTNMLEFFETRMKRHEFLLPDWMTDEPTLFKIVRSHQCALLIKDYLWYKDKFPKLAIREAFNTPYFWPR